MIEDSHHSFEGLGMSRSQASVSQDQAASRVRRAGTLLPAFIVGLPLAAGIIYLIRSNLLGEQATAIAQRYLHHDVECAEVVMFCCALAALGAKLWRWFWTERPALRAEMLPAWDGQTVPVEKAGELLAGLERQPRRLQGTFLGCRIGNVLDFLRSRGSAAELDDQLRTLTDNDVVAMEGSYSFTRFITWAIPILGFLGTVLGITGAISGVTPEKLEKDLTAVTDGLSLAFDATALALSLTMVLMFISFLVERAEQGILDAVDRFVDRHLAHRFERTGSEGGEFVEVVRQNTQVLVKATEQLVHKQAEVWAKTLQEVDRKRNEAEQHMQERMTQAIESALEHTLETHSRRLASLEKAAAEQGTELLQRLAAMSTALRDTGREQQAALAKITQAMAGQTEALTQLLEGEQHLVQLQDALNKNLNALAGSGAFEQSVHSLTAAIHLLTAYLVPKTEARGPQKRPGAAA
jgi:hypothetical protein